MNQLKNIDELEQEFANMSDDDVTNSDPVEEVSPRKRKRINRRTEGTKIYFENIETGEEVELDLAELSSDIIDRLTVHGALQKLGDAAAGKSGAEITDAITKVRDGLLAGEFNVKAEPGSRVSKSSIKDKLVNMSDEEKEHAREVLASLGIHDV